MINEEHVRIMDAFRNLSDQELSEYQELFGGRKALMMLVMFINFFGSFLVSEDKKEHVVGSIIGVGSSGLMIGMAVLQFQDTDIDYSTQAMTDFFNIYFPSMFLIFGFFQSLYCFLSILKSCKKEAVLTLTVENRRMHDPASRLTRFT